MFSPGFPPNYSPFKQHSIDDPPPIPDAVKQKAKAQGAEYIHKSGKYSVKWWYGKMLTIDGPDFEAWNEHQGRELPAGELVKL